MVLPMLRIAWSNLVRERTRFAVSVGGVLLAVALMTIMRGLYLGITAESAEYLGSLEADLWVAQGGSTGDFFHSESMLPADLERQVAAVEGVGAVTPFVGRSVSVRAAGGEAGLFLVGIDPSTSAGAPRRIVAGTVRPAGGEIVLDEVFARQHGLRVGSRLMVADRPFTVSGIARGGHAAIHTFAWGSRSDVQALVGEAVVNYLLVRTDQTPARIVLDRIKEHLPETRTFTHAELLGRSTADVRDNFRPVLWIMLGVALAVGICVVGLTVYTAALEKSAEYGVLRAIGLSSRTIIGVVVVQSLTAATLGFCLGAALAFGAASVLDDLVPAFVARLTVPDVGVAAVATLVMAVVSAVLPVSVVARLAPAEVFRR